MTITLGSLRITLFKSGFFKTDVLPSFKDQVVRNIEAANSYEYRAQVAEHHLMQYVIDDILSDPFWREVAVEAVKARKS